MRYALLAVLLVPMLCFAGEREDSAELNKLLKDIRAQLPPTWRADTRVQRRRDVELELFIQTSTAVEVHLNAPNMPLRTKDEPPEPPKRDLYEISYRVRPFMTPEQYTQAKAKNAENNARRVAFAKAHLEAVKYFHMGPSPIPPTSYQPADDHGRELVQQYAILWMHTEPLPLPTHYRGMVAFDLWDDWATLVDPSLQKELVSITKTLDGLFTPYEPPKKD